MSEWKSAFPELNRVELEELCLRQNARVLELLAAAKRALATFKAQGESVRPGNVLGALEAAIKATGEQP